MRVREDHRRRIESQRFLGHLPRIHCGCIKVAAVAAVPQHGMAYATCTDLQIHIDCESSLVEFA